MRPGENAKPKKEICRRGNTKKEKFNPISLSSGNGSRGLRRRGQKRKLKGWKGKIMS